MGETLTFVLILVGGSIAALLAMGIIFSKLYRRATKEMSFVRTGMGGQKVIIDGGCLELPVFHDIILVNMQTLRLEVDRKQKDALITKEKLMEPKVTSTAVQGGIYSVRDSAEH